MIQNYPPIHGFALIGGFLWCTGNLLCPIAIRFIGIGLGLILWGCSSMILGWATGKYGLFQLKKQDIGDPILNYIGMCLAIIGLFVFVHVKTKDTSLDSKTYRIMKNYYHYNNNDNNNSTNNNNNDKSNNNNNSNNNNLHHHHHHHHHHTKSSLHASLIGRHASPDRIRTDLENDIISQPMVIDSQDRNLSVRIDEVDDHLHHDYDYRHGNDDEDEDSHKHDEGPYGVDVDDEAYIGRFDSSIYEDSVTTGTIDNNSNSNVNRYRNKRGNHHHHHYNNYNNNNNDKLTISFGDDWTDETKRIVGIICALSAGLFFGTSFDPSQYIIDHNYNGNDDTLNYVFSHYLGILITSWFYTILYCIYCHYHNIHPYITSEIFLPASASGIIWGIAETSYFLANGKLGFPITFPIISSGPGLIGSLWGVFIYQEINGVDNLRMLALAFCITIPALILVGLSH